MRQTSFIQCQCSDCLYVYLYENLSDNNDWCSQQIFWLHWPTQQPKQCSDQLNNNRQRRPSPLSNMSRSRVSSSAAKELDFSAGLFEALCDPKVANKLKELLVNELRHEAAELRQIVQSKDKQISKRKRKLTMSTVLASNCQTRHAQF